MIFFIERHGQTSDGSIHNEFPRPNGYASPCAVLSAQTIGDYQIYGIFAIQGVASRYKQYSGNRLLHGL